MKRSPMRRDTPGAIAWTRKKRRRVNPESEKGTDARRKWQQRRDAHLAANPTCILASVVPTPCWGRLTVHHVVPRGMGGTKNDTSELVTACAGHHDYIELNREWARARGFLRRATA